MGKADGIVMELRNGEPPGLTCIEVGMTILARRLNSGWESWIAAILSKWGAKQSQPLRIPWSKVRDVGIDVEVDVDAETTSALAYEKWLRDRMITRIPGGR